MKKKCRGHPHLRGDSYLRYYTFQQPIVIEKPKTCKEKLLETLKYYFCRKQ